jgi:hypothetical protein
MAFASPVSPDPRAAKARRANLRVALSLASIAVVFFAGIIAVQLLGSTEAGLTVVGAAVFLFLVVAIGRNLWGK